MNRPASDLKLGDFTGLAENYTKYRPGYAPSVLKALLGLLNKPVAQVDFVDVGAGTGIWTTTVARSGVHSATAVEPNDDMRTHGMAYTVDFSVRWTSGSGEATGLPDSCCDWVTMASSFHWVDFNKGTREFHRILRPGGWFTALWNPRLIEVNPMLVEIEDKLYEIAPDIERKSSGRASFTETLTDKLGESPCFDDVIYLEGRHTEAMTPERYIGAWRSVNDIQVQAGPERFGRFMSYVEERVQGLNVIEATYMTRAWAARRALS